MRRKKSIACERERAGEEKKETVNAQKWGWEEKERM